MRDNPKPQEIYKHFKGNLYQIVTIANHSETGEKLVIYQALYGDFTVYARPLEMFLEEVDRNKYPKTEQKYRFELYQPSNTVVDACEGKGEAQNEKIEVQSEEKFEEQNVDANTKDQIGDEEYKLDARVLDFLDANTYEQKLGILATMHGDLTNDMLNTMAAAEDIELKEGEIEERYEEFKHCLLTLDRFECNRLRS